MVRLVSVGCLVALAVFGGANSSSAQPASRRDPVMVNVGVEGFQDIYGDSETCCTARTMPNVSVTVPVSPRFAFQGGASRTDRPYASGVRQETFWEFLVYQPLKVGAVPHVYPFVTYGIVNVHVRDSFPAGVFQDYTSGLLELRPHDAYVNEHSGPGWLAGSVGLQVDAWRHIGIRTELQWLAPFAGRARVSVVIPISRFRR